MNQAACQEIRKNSDQGGSIINFAYSDGVPGAPYHATYAASKGAVSSWTRTIADEWARKYKIRCNSILPAAKTPMYQQYLESLSPQEMEDFKRLMVELGA
ncbi:MAG: SDR family oxidoreductase [Syntrophomonas sp.]